MKLETKYLSRAQLIQTILWFFKLITYMSLQDFSMVCNEYTRRPRNKPIQLNNIQKTVTVLH